MSGAANNTLSCSGFEDQYEEEEEPHFLQLCFLCNKHLGHNSDIFMYRGNTPFCSKDCRQEQIEFDEANERSRRVCSSKRSHGKAESNEESAAAGTVAVA